MKERSLFAVRPKQLNIGMALGTYYTIMKWKRILT